MLLLNRGAPGFGPAFLRRRTILWPKFLLDPGDNIETRQFTNTVPKPHGQPAFEASSDGLAIGADGVLYIKGSYLFAAMNIMGQSEKCRFGGYIFL